MRGSGGRGGRLSERARRTRRRFPGPGGTLKRVYGGVPPTAAFSGGAGRERRRSGRRRAGRWQGTESARCAEPRPRLVFSGIRYGPRNSGSRAACGPTHHRANELDLAFTVSLVVHRRADRPCSAAVLRKEPVVMAAGNWRRITRSVHSGNRAAAHIIASHRLLPFEPLSGAAPKSSPFTPPVRAPGDAGDRAFPAISSAAPGKRSDLGSCRREAQRAYGACWWSPAVRGGSFGVLRATPCRRTPGRGRMAEPGRAMKRRSGTGRARRSAPAGRSVRRSSSRAPGRAPGRVGAWRSLSS